MGSTGQLTDAPGSASEVFPSLARPPIVEVVAGLLFDPLPLDGLLLGVYWDRRKADFPKHSLQPALVEGPRLILGNHPFRAMLESEDGVLLLQLQHDRLYLNWRARGTDYPRFSSGAPGSGLLYRALEEYQRFADFCAERLHLRPTVRRVELVKVDLLKRGEVWTDTDDLAALVPITSPLNVGHRASQREISLRVVEHHDNEMVVVAMSSVRDGPGGAMTALHIETRVLRALAVAEMPEAALRDANVTANRVFRRLVPDWTRFGLQPEPTP